MEKLDRLRDHFSITVLQELGNGTLYVIGIMLILSASMYLLASYLEHRVSQGETLLVVPRSSWYRRMDVQIVLGWLTFATGYTIRAYWNWALRECQNERGHDACLHIEHNYTLLFVAMVLVILGGACAIGRMLPAALVAVVVVSPVSISLAIPLMYRFAF